MLQALIPSTASGGALPPLGNPFRARVARSYAKAVQQGYRPATDAVITDVRSSERFARFTVNKFPCVTAEKGRSYGFHVSTTASTVTPEMLLAMHGMPRSFFKPHLCGVSRSQFGHMLGNTISLNVLMRALPRALFSAGLIDSLPAVDFWEKVVAECRSKKLTEPVP